MTADKLLFPIQTTKSKEVTMVKRFAVLAIVLAAFLILAVPAFAANGYRADYTTSDACQTCHQAGQPLDAPKVYNDWAATKHGTDSEAVSAAKSLPYGSVCAGCHTANYDPTKVTPSPSGTTWVPAVSTTTAPQALGSAPFSEFDIGCSSCHYGAAVSGNNANSGNDANDTAHTAAFGKLANAEICGACHSRFSYTVNPITVQATPTPGTTLIQPQMAIGYPMLGVNYQPLSNFLNVSKSGWTPTPTATKTGFPNLQTYWVVDGTTTPWQQSGHDGSAAQYPEWLSSGHASSLADLKAAVGPNPPASCLQCHSADYQISVANGQPVPTGAEAQYGDTCVSCHTPHQAGTTQGVWLEDYDSQLVGNPSNPSDVCTTCHTAQTNGGVAAAGATIHNDQNEVMNGTGAIGVPQGLPGVHKGKCVQCHMVPTSYSRGSAQLGANHTMDIVTPQDAVDATPVPVTTATVKPTATPTVSGTPVATTTVTVTQGSMPYSACSTCHTNAVQTPAVTVSTVTTTPSPTASPRQETVTITQNAGGGDKALWLQDTIDQRQAAMHAAYNNVAAELHNGGLRMGFQHTANDADYNGWLNGVLNTKGSSVWTTAELTWQKAYTDWTYVGAEGSWGIHNYQYDSLVIDAALTFANQVDKTPQTVTFKLSKKSVKKNTKVTFSGTVSPATAGTVQIQKKKNGVFSNWKAAKLGSSGKYSLKVKMTKKGTFYYRAYFPADPSYSGGTTGQIKLVVKK
jgi:hypothetical protein